MKTCNNCENCVRRIIQNGETIVLDFMCNDKILNSYELSDYDVHNEPACIVVDCIVESFKNTKRNHMTDNVNHPSHYTWLKEACGIEVIDITRHFCFDIGNALKYLLRAGHKKEASMSDLDKEIEDLKKAIWYINDHIKGLEKEREINICQEQAQISKMSEITVPF